MDATTQQTLDLMKQALETSSPEVLRKAGYAQPSTATTGLQGYDLEAPAKMLYPVLTPLRNEIPRVTDGYGTQANWKAVTDIDTGREFPGVSEGNRARAITPTMTDYNAVYRGFGYEHYSSFEANYAGKTFIDIRAQVTREALQSAMIGEEFVILGGNGTAVGLALGTANTPSGTLQTGVGAMTAQANVCYVVGLTMAGLRSSLSTAAFTYTGSTGTYISPAGGSVKVQFTRTNQDSSTDTINPGHGIASAESASVTTAAANLGVDWVVVPKKGEMAWAWFTGLTGAANCKLAAITTVPKFKQRADALSTQAANAADLASDRSKDALVYDGILTQIFNNGYYVGNSAAPAATGSGGVDVLNTFLQDRWDNYRLTDFTIWVNSRDRITISNLILGNGVSNSAVRLTIPEGGGQTSITGNTVVSGYHSPINGNVLPINVHPYLPAGTILITHRGGLPYAMAGVPNVWQVKNRAEYYSIEWPLKTRKYEIGIYWDSVLQGYFPAGNGIIQLAA